MSTAAEYIANQLKANRITCVFGYQGGNITYMVDAVARCPEMRYIQTYNEQSAAFAANAYAQISDNFGVAVSSSGPGAINMINGIANAYFDSIPCLFITGNVNSATMKTDKKIRQEGFQETNIVDMVREITKFAKTVTDVSELPTDLKKALEMMKSGRPGPVLLDIPHDVQRCQLDNDVYRENIFCVEQRVISSRKIAKIVDLITSARNPVILVGNGCRSNDARRLLKELVDKYPVNVVSSLCGKDVLDNNHPCFRGMIGSYGLTSANQILNDADTVLVLGSRLDERQRIVAKVDFLKNAKVIHVDIDKNELGHVVKADLKLNVPVELFLQKLIPQMPSSSQIAGYDNVPVNGDEQYILGKTIHEQLQKIIINFAENSNFCVDVGKHQMLAAQSVCVGANSRYLNSAGLGSMGYAIPAAIGAYYASGKTSVCIVGDGGLMMNLQELQVFSRENIPLTLVVVNNRALGLIEDYHKKVFDGRLYGSKWGYSVPDLKKISECFDFDYVKINKFDEVKIKDSARILIEFEV